MVPDGAPNPPRILPKVLPESTLMPKWAPKGPRDPKMLRIGGPRASKMLKNRSQSHKNKARNVQKYAKFSQKVFNFSIIIMLRLPFLA